ncbi:zinc-ribbon domain-containing protein [Frondihabitans sp. 4ASC-45]|uniref:zinc-ribbon domain-containing protein n=1 Tax=Frondihabitans sp. 4ASC-45 TaxID=3111636 RepID=UPI003C1D8BE0
MPEPILAWWARRQLSRRSAVPYAVGTYRDAWAPYPVLVRQYHPEYNGGIMLTQVPPAADVFLCWQCETGHVFVATPEEQRARPGRERRRSSWCPACLEMAAPRRTSASAGLAAALAPDPSSSRASAPARRHASARRASPVSALCAKTPALAVGEPFASLCAPPPASAVEAQLRADLAARLEFTAGVNAVRLAQPFFDHLEAWPDILLPELRVAIEYDSTGRHGLEHVGKREVADRRKDRLLRAAGWEVIRVRTGKLQPLGPYDLVASGLTKQTVPALLDRLRDVRGSLFVDAYLQPASGA